MWHVARIPGHHALSFYLGNGGWGRGWCGCFGELRIHHVHRLQCQFIRTLMGPSGRRHPGWALAPSHVPARVIGPLLPPMCLHVSLGPCSLPCACTCHRAPAAKGVLGSAGQSAPLPQLRPCPCLSYLSEKQLQVVCPQGKGQARPRAARRH